MMHVITVHAKMVIFVLCEHLSTVDYELSSVFGEFAVIGEYVQNTFI